MQKANHPRGFRFLSKLIIVVGLISAAVAYQAPAQTITTDPVGFITLTATGKTTTAGLYNFWSLGMTQVPVLRGMVGSIVNTAGNQVTISNQTLTAGQFNEANTVGSSTEPSYFVEFTSGSGAGLLDDIVSNDTAAIYTATDDSSMESVGTTIKIYPHWTIGTVFGPQNQAGLLGGSSSSGADNIEVWNPVAQSYGSATYYYKTTTTLGGSGWRSSASSSINVSNTVLYVDQGIIVDRKTAAGNVNVLLVGGVKLGPTMSVIYGTNSAGLGFTYAGNVFPAPVTLGTSGLYTGNNTTGLNGGSSGSGADEVEVWAASGQTYSTYYYKTTTSLGGSGWRSTGSSSIDCSTNQVPLGDIVRIQRKIKGAFTWTMPQPF
jgi:uncharacterized protein (TIGR02597 family)